MITKWIQFTVEPASAGMFHSELARLELESKAESGCVLYAAYRDARNSGIFTVLESWESEAAFEAHRHAPHVAAFKEVCGSAILEKTGQSLVGIQP